MKRSSFSEQTTIHGIRYIIGKDQKLYCRVLWLTVFLGCLCFCIWQVYTTVAAYLQYATITRISLKSIEKYSNGKIIPIEFPAITICNNNQMKRSLVSKELGQLYGPLVDSYHNSSTNANIQAGQSMCSYQGKPIQNKELLSFIIQANKSNDVYGTARSIGFAKVQSMVNHDSYSSVVGCKWNGIDSNCTSWFLNHFTQSGWCFTFNPSITFLNQFKLLEDTVANNYSSATAYGTTQNIINNTRFNVSSPGYSNGISFILNVESDEYCTSGLQNSIRFKAYVHDRDIVPLQLEKRLIDLQPGQAINVAIKITETNRNTEFLGGCVSNYYLKMYPNSTTYTQDMCYLQCFTEYIYNNTNDTDQQCLPLYAPGYALNVLNTSMVCLNKPQIKSQAVAEAKMMASGQQYELCNCPKACNEMEYSSDITSTYYPSENVFSTILIEQNLPLNINYTWYRNNYLLVNFFIDKIEYTVITEDQAIKWNDLINSLGGALGLCLGASLMSMFEVICWIFNSGTSSVCDKKKTNVSHQGTQGGLYEEKPEFTVKPPVLYT